MGPEQQERQGHLTNDWPKVSNKSRNILTDNGTEKDVTLLIYNSKIVMVKTKTEFNFIQ